MRVDGRRDAPAPRFGEQHDPWPVRYDDAAELLGMPPRRRWPFHIYTGSLSELRTEKEGASLIYLNRIDHLADAGLDVDSLKDR